MRFVNVFNAVVGEVNIDEPINRKNYTDCEVVMNFSVNKFTFEDVVEYIVGYFSENPDVLQKAGERFRFAFPIL